MSGWRAVRWWIATGLYVITAPLPAAAAASLWAEHGSTAAALLVTALAGIAAVLCLAGGLAAARTAARTAASAAHAGRGTGPVDPEPVHAPARPEAAGSPDPPVAPGCTPTRGSQL